MLSLAFERQGVQLRREELLDKLRPIDRELGDAPRCETRNFVNI